MLDSRASEFNTYRSWQVYRPEAVQVLWTPQYQSSLGIIAGSVTAARQRRFRRLVGAIGRRLGYLIPGRLLVRQEARRRSASAFLGFPVLRFTTKPTGSWK